MEDQIAISRLKQGDPGGLETLVRDYQVRAVYTAYMILFDRSLAEEIVQTAFVRVAEKIQYFDELRPFAPWFLRIVVNEALRVSRQQRLTVSLDENPDEASLTVARWLLDPQPRPEKLVELAETRQALLNALRCLPAEQRAVVVMRYYLEMSEADMSAKLERPISTIKWRLHTARERLKTLLRASRLFEDRE